jgi:hypothetical protein
MTKLIFFYQADDTKTNWDFSENTQAARTTVFHNKLRKF